jgi:hypothetical protein
MKIGVVTFHRAINIGGALQAFALQHFLKEQGCTSEIIDYRCPAIEEQYYSVQWDWKFIKRLLSAIIRNGVIKRNIIKFQEFREKYLPVSERAYYPSDIRDANDVYDIFITGSDQVWSWNCAGFDKTYFLDFVTKPNAKYAYAASFGGSELPNEFNVYYQGLLKDFNEITVREASGEEIVSSVSDISASVVLDPTLLLHESTWRKNLIEPYPSCKPYILVYLIAECKELLSRAKKIGEDRNLDVIYVSDRIYKPSGVISKRNVGPKEFISLVNGSQVVVTNSYHGICFSMIFKKDLVVGLLRQNTAVNARLMHVISKYGLQKRLIDSEEFSLDSEIDFQLIEGLIRKEQHKSVQWARQFSVNHT